MTNSVKKAHSQHVGEKS